MISYRKAKMNELEAITKLNMEAFDEYPLFTIIQDRLKDRKLYRKFLYNVQRISTKAYLKQERCLVAVMDDQIVAAAMLESPNYRSSIITYIVNGGLKITKYLSIGTLTSYFNFFNKINSDCEKLDIPNWYLASFAVSKNHQGQHIGSKMLNDCIIPYVKDNQGVALSLITNTKANYIFYMRNQFEVFAEQTLSWNEAEVENWSFLKKL